MILLPSLQIAVLPGRRTSLQSHSQAGLVTLFCVLRPVEPQWSRSITKLVVTSATPWVYNKGICDARCYEVFVVRVVHTGAGNFQSAKPKGPVNSIPAVG